MEGRREKGREMVGKGGKTGIDEECETGRDGERERGEETREGNKGGEKRKREKE